MNQPPALSQSITPDSITPISWPRRALRAAVYLIFVECLLLAFPSTSWVVPGLLAGMALSRLWTIRRGWVLRIPMGWNAAFLAVGFAVKFSLSPADFPTDATFISTELAHEVGCWLVSAQLLLLHDRRSLERVPVHVAALGCLVVLCAGDVRLHSVSRSMMLVLMILFIGGLGWASHAGREWIKVDQRRRLRRGIMIATLALAGFSTIQASRIWYEHERELEMLLLQVMRTLDGHNQGPQVRYRPPMIDVTDGRITNPELPTLRVNYNGTEPLYLRGRALDRYMPSGWSMKLDQFGNSPLKDTNLPPGIQPAANLFQLNEDVTADWQPVTLQTLVQDDSIPYVPLETDYLDVRLGELSQDRLRNIHPTEEGRPEVWRAYVGSGAGHGAPPQGDELELPSLDPGVVDLASQILGNCKTFDEKVTAVEDHFHKNYRYQVGINIPAGQDPVTYFLLHRKPAHCEFFATGAAVLLRLGRVPTRYVTGYVPSENHGSGNWLARRKDAHAWVEAYDYQTKRWQIVEATPSDGLPDVRQASWTEHLSETWRVWSAQMKQSIEKLGFWRTCLSLLQSFWMRAILVFILGWGWWSIVRRYRAKAVPRGSAATVPDRALNQWLTRIEDQLARIGLVRAPHETLFQFQQRIIQHSEAKPLRPTAEWISRYGEVRYGEPNQAASQWAALEATAAALVGASPDGSASQASHSARSRT